MQTIEQLPAGRELDALIAEKVMGRCPHRETRRYCIEDGNSVDSGYECVACGKDVYGSERCPAFSTDMTAAWPLVEKLRADGMEVDLLSEPGNVDGWAVKTNRPDEEFCQIVTAPTAPLAICRAALATVESEAAR